MDEAVETRFKAVEKDAADLKGDNDCQHKKLWIKIGELFDLLQKRWPVGATAVISILTFFLGASLTVIGFLIAKLF